MVESPAAIAMLCCGRNPSTRNFVDVSVAQIRSNSAGQSTRNDSSCFWRARVDCCESLASLKSLGGRVESTVGLMAGVLMVRTSIVSGIARCGFNAFGFLNHGDLAVVEPDLNGAVETRGC